MRNERTPRKTTKPGSRSGQTKKSFGSSRDKKDSGGFKKDSKRGEGKSSSFKPKKYSSDSGDSERSPRTNSRSGTGTKRSFSSDRDNKDDKGLGKSSSSFKPKRYSSDDTEKSPRTRSRSGSGTKKSFGSDRDKRKSSSSYQPKSYSSDSENTERTPRTNSRTGTGRTKSTFDSSREKDNDNREFKKSSSSFDKSKTTRGNGRFNKSEEKDSSKTFRSNKKKPDEKESFSEFKDKKKNSFEERKEYKRKTGIKTYTDKKGEKTYTKDTEIVRNRDASKSYKKVKNYTKTDDDGLVRLNKYIANAGICSRREADTYIESGVVTVNGAVITELGYRIKPGDKVMFGDRPIIGEKHVYILLNKPKDYITTSKDPQNRKTVLELINGVKERVFPVGRLDRNTTGVLLLTNDGVLAEKLMHPRKGVKKIYHAELDKRFSAPDMAQLKKGLSLEDGLFVPDEVDYVDGMDKHHVGIEIHSGANRIVRRAFESLDYNVIKLDRVIYAGLTKKGLTRGKWRFLKDAEIHTLKMM